MLTARLARAGALAERCATRPPAGDDPAWAALLDVVTVQETRLFRHPEQCLALAETLPALAAAARAERRPLRLLSAGCATGEEAYTLAALAHPVAPGECEVVGLDLCRPALTRAAEFRLGDGVGAPLDLVPAPYRPWLSTAEGAPRVHPTLREQLHFHRANLLDGLDGYGLFDVVFCRNVLIYLEEAARIAVLAHLGAALRPGGLLGLGLTDRAPAGWPSAHRLWRRPDDG